MARKGATMLAKMKLVGAATLASGALAAGLAAPGASAQPIITGGLVNVTVTDVLNNNTVTVDVPIGAALNLAANVCDVNVNVLSTQLKSGGATCTNGDQTSIVTITP
jgi:hypothetical protein